MINLHSIVFMIVTVFCWSGAFYLIVTDPIQIKKEQQQQQQPKLYCQYGAGYGVAVYDYEAIGNNQIVTDADDVFDLLVCDEWSKYAK